MEEAENGNVTILVVDDVNLNLRQAELILKKYFPCDVVLASSGKGCIQVVLQQKIDLLLLDIAMPELDGIETLQLIRRHAEFRDIPVIFLTASADPLTIVKATELKVDDYIRKPFKVDNLLERVEKVLRAHGWQPPQSMYE